MDKLPSFTSSDAERITAYLSDGPGTGSRDWERWKSLHEKIGRGTVLPPSSVPSTLVTMNSTVRLKDLITKKEILITLVFPDDANIEQGRLSVLSPMGSAILGYSLGDSVKWEEPPRSRHVRIVRIAHRTEAAEGRAP